MSKSRFGRAKAKIQIPRNIAEIAYLPRKGPLPPPPHPTHAQKKETKVKHAASVGSTYKFVLKGRSVLALVHSFNLEAYKNAQIHSVLNNAQRQRSEDNDEVSLVFVSQETAPIIFLLIVKETNQTL